MLAFVPLRGGAWQTVPLAVLTLVGPLSAQTFQGRVVGEGGEPVPTALVRLDSTEGEQVAFALADSLGRYRVDAPSPGEYVLVAERIGYEPFRSHLLAVSHADGTYPVEIVMRAAPLPIRGIDVSADRLERIERGIRLEIGMSPRSLRVTPIFRAAILDHLERGHDLTDVIRWANVPSMIVRQTLDGPCFQYRNRGCLPVYLNGQRMTSEWTEALPLGLAETIVVVLPDESIQYPGGAIILYTEGWIVR